MATAVRDSDFECILCGGMTLRGCKKGDFCTGVHIDGAELDRVYDVSLSMQCISSMTLCQHTLTDACPKGNACPLFHTTQASIDNAVRAFRYKRHFKGKYDRKGGCKGDGNCGGKGDGKSKGGCKGDGKSKGGCKGDGASKGGCKGDGKSKGGCKGDGKSKCGGKGDGADFDQVASHGSMWPLAIHGRQDPHARLIKDMSHGQLISHGVPFNMWPLEMQESHHAPSNGGSARHSGFSANDAPSSQPAVQYTRLRVSPGYH
jgi:hypothetical protein